MAFGLILTAIIALTIGPVNIPVATVFKILFRFPQSWPDSYNVIVMDVRLPRILLGGLVGSALAVAGCAMQGLFKNPMASPYILGISSGSAFGASLAIVLGVGMAAGALAVPLMAFIFAIVTILLVYNISRVGGRVPVETLLLAGIAVGAFFGAQVSLMKYFAGEELRSIVFWLMGGFWASSWDKVAIAFPLILLGVAAIMFFSRDLNIMLMGEDHALDMGINVESDKKIILIFASLITAAAVSVSGIIGFVGLIIPHIMRIIVGPDHRILLPASCLVGALFLICADTIARTIIQPTELPVGIITASFGAPFFLYLLRKRKRVTGW
ncbi:MAG: iron chelate uptake ABC transporter family permease subunit [Thermoplasmata archaeon]|nr:iron chelate uptake ABC transporter family permease subunit [Thermoplasmata archaeon]